MTAAALGTLLGAAVIHLLRAVRRLGTRPAPAPAAPWTAVPDGTRWLPCHSTTCAHLTRPHHPTQDGYTCADCGRINGGPQ